MSGRAARFYRTAAPILSVSPLTWGAPGGQRYLLRYLLLIAGSLERCLRRGPGGHMCGCGWGSSPVSARESQAVRSRHCHVCCSGTAPPPRVRKRVRIERGMEQRRKTPGDTAKGGWSGCFLGGWVREPGVEWCDGGSGDGRRGWLAMGLDLWVPHWLRPAPGRVQHVCSAAPWLPMQHRAPCWACGGRTVRAKGFSGTSGAIHTQSTSDLSPLSWLHPHGSQDRPSPWGLKSSTIGTRVGVIL